jgi:hypothetical protein
MRCLACVGPWYNITSHETVFHADRVWHEPTVSLVRLLNHHDQHTRLGVNTSFLSKRTVRARHGRDSCPSMNALLPLEDYTFQA